MFLKEAQENMLLEPQIYDAIHKLETGDASYLKIAFFAMAFEDREIVRNAGHGIRKCLEHATVAQMIMLNERFRNYSSFDSSIHWKKIDIREKKTWFHSEQDYLYVLILGSFHSDGYFREICATELYHYPNTLGYLLLRVNDWVPSIRKNMFLLSLERLEHCSVTELFLSLQHMEKLKRSKRNYYEEVMGLCPKNHEEVMRIYPLLKQKVEDALSDFPLEKIKYFEFETRKIIYRLFIEKHLLNFSQMNVLLKHEKHGFCKRLLITNILQHYDCSKEQMAQYLRDKSVVVRRKALEYRYSVTKNTWDGLERMLLDSNRGIRELAAYIIRRHSDFPILPFYIRHLEDENPAAAIAGIGEQGDKESGTLLLPFLESSVPKIVRLTLKALSKIIGTDGAEIYMQYLANKDFGISKTAYHAIQANPIRGYAEQLYDYCIHSAYPHVKRYAFLLLLQDDTWERLPFLLDLYGNKTFASYQELILKTIKNRDMYGKLSGQKAELIYNRLKENEQLLPPQLGKEILFDIKFLTQ